MYKEVPRAPSLTQRAVNQLETLILGDSLKPGDQLPAVNDLAAQLGVSRTVIREAIGALAARGLVEVRHGTRTVVSRPSAATAARSLTRFLRAGRPELDFSRVSQVRRVLEIEVTRLAAEHRTAEDLAGLEDILRGAAELAANDTGDQATREKLYAADLDFHMALAQATQNELFTLLLNSIADIMLEVRELGFHVPGAAAYALEAHRAIFERVQAGDPAGARQAMSDHLARSDDFMRRGLEVRTSGSRTRKQRRAEAPAQP